MKASFRLRTRRLMAAPVLVLAAIAVVTALVKSDKLPSWLAWLPPWGLAVMAAVLGVLGTWWIEPWTRRRQAETQQERESLDPLRQHLGRQDRLPRIGEPSAQALALRVHPATGLSAEHTDVRRPTRPPKPKRRWSGPHDTSSGLDPDLPIFVDRDKGSEIRAWMQTARRTGGFLLLVGNSCVGKTRLLYESARQELTDFAVLAPDPGHGDLINTTAKAAFPLPKLIVWLDELQTFLEGPYLLEGATAITAEAIRRLLDAPTSVVIVGTLWPEYARALRATQQDPVTGRNRALYPRTVEILSGSRLHEVGLTSFSERERIAAEHLAAGDPRLARALADRAYNVTEALAGAPELIRRYERATETQQAVIHAAVDARRLGIQAPLTSDLLCTAGRGYLTTLHFDDAWFPPVLEEITSATQPQDRATAPLIPVLNDQHTEVIGYTVADYLLQHLTRRRRTIRLPATVWQALADHPHTIDDLRRLAYSAIHRLLYRYAESLFRRLLAAGDRSAYKPLGALLAFQGRADDAISLLRDKGPEGEPAVLLALNASGFGDQAIKIAREGVDADLWWGEDVLARILAAQGRTDELRKRADGGDVWAMSALTDLLAAQGRTDELRKRAESGDPAAGMRLVELEGKQKHTEWLRNASEQDWQAYRRRTDQLRERTDPSDHVTWVSVAQMLGEQGRISEAIEILREHVNVLREQAQTEDTQVLGVQLADALAELGCTDDAIEILREGAGAGSLIAAQRLVTLLAKQGPAEDLWREVDAGTIFASEALIELLETGEETKQRGVHIRRFGLNPDGSIASEHTAERTDFLRYRDR